MSKSVMATPPSKGLRTVLRLPIWLYRMHLGWLLGNRFLLLEHTGRNSGQVHETVIEVVKHDPTTDAYYVVSGWGPKADWYLNIQKNAFVTIQIGGRRLPAHALTVSMAEAADILKGYSERYRVAFRELTQLFLGERLQPGYEAGRMLAERMPMVVFWIRQQADP